MYLYQNKDKTFGIGGGISGRSRGRMKGWCRPSIDVLSAFIAFVILLCRKVSMRLLASILRKYHLKCQELKTGLNNLLKTLKKDVGG